MSRRAKYRLVTARYILWPVFQELQPGVDVIEDLVHWEPNLPSNLEHLAFTVHHECKGGQSVEHHR